MNLNEDKWIDQILSSTEKKSEIPVSEELRQRLMRIPSEMKMRSSTIPMRAVFAVAAGIALLISLNVLALKNTSKKEVIEHAIYTEYFSYLEQL
jgi:hypothetical protein